LEFHQILDRDRMDKAAALISVDQAYCGPSGKLETTTRSLFYELLTTGCGPLSPATSYVPNRRLSAETFSWKLISTDSLSADKSLNGWGSDDALNGNRRPQN
jgi:hypothetical protein